MTDTVQPLIDRADQILQQLQAAAPRVTEALVHYVGMNALVSVIGWTIILVISIAAFIAGAFYVNKTGDSDPAPWFIVPAFIGIGFAVFNILSNLAAALAPEGATVLAIVHGSL